MKYAVNAKEMKQIDQITIEEIKIPSLVLMERAALCVAKEVEEIAEKQDRILAVCGMGNNGADAVAAARMLYLNGFFVTVLLLGDQKKASDEMKQQLLIAENIGLTVGVGQTIAEYTIIIDGIFGVGLDRAIEGFYCDRIKEINNSKAKVVAVDIPSGICAETGQVLGHAVQADRTVTFGLMKSGLLLYPGTSYAKKVRVVDIGFPDCVIRRVDPKVHYFEKKDLEKFPKRRADGHKGSFGKVLVIAGAANMAGAACLASKAAYHMGCGLVKTVTSAEGAMALSSYCPEVLTENLAFWMEQEDLTPLFSFADVCLVGPGLGKSKKMKDFFFRMLKFCKEVPLVLDADALNLLAEHLEGITLEERILELSLLLPKHTILTPHRKELERLLGGEASLQKDLFSIVKQCAKENHLVLVCKDARTIAAYQDHYYINVTGNDGMATGGSGDVLAGMITGLLALSLSPFPAVQLGVFLHGIAGDFARKQVSAPFLLAGDLIRALPTVFLEMWKDEKDNGDV